MTTPVPTPPKRDALQLARTLRIPALLCALAVPVCILFGRPVAEMGICDDGPYIRIAQHLAATGHIAYNGWPAPILGWQLYLGAACIRLLGFSYTHVRMGTWLVSAVMAFMLQRGLVAANLSERNATIGTLALVLSPLYVLLSATYMTDIYGLFAVVLCLYGCLRALRAATDSAAIGWLGCAAATNALFGTARQIGWLGIFVLLPCTLWLLRARRRVLLAGVTATLLGAAFVLACVHWFAQQPYAQTEAVLLNPFPLWQPGFQLFRVALAMPFLLLPIMALFLPEMRRSRPRTIAVLYTLLFGYLALACYKTGHPVYRGVQLHMEPFMGDWVNVEGIYGFVKLKGGSPPLLTLGEQAVLTIASIGGLFGLVSALLHPRKAPPSAQQAGNVTWGQLRLLLASYLILYTLLLVPRAVHVSIPDRYALGLVLASLILLVRYYQDRIHPKLPAAGYVLVGILAVYSIVLTHNWFALYRARVVLAAELRSAGLPDTAVDNGWEYNFDVEIQQAGHINDPRVLVPRNAYQTTPPPPPGPCHAVWYDNTPHLHPIYGVSFDPDRCYGLAPFAPVHYDRWLAPSPGTLYVVKYTQDAPFTVPFTAP
jgi:hypothetical protein